MSLKVVIYLLLLILLVNLTKVRSEQTDQEIIEKGRYEISNILKFLDDNRKREEEFRKTEFIPQDQVSKQQRFKEKNELDKLELKIREQIENILQRYESKEPLNVEYWLQIKTLNKDLSDVKALIKRIHDRLTQEQRTLELNNIKNIRQSVAARKEYEQKLRPVEQPPKDKTAQSQRAGEQASLENLEKMLLDSANRLENWHAKNLPFNEEYLQISASVKYNVEAFTSITKKMDLRRIKERLDEAQEIADMKKLLNARSTYESQARQKEPPAKSPVLAALRKNEQIIEDNLDSSIRKRLQLIEQRLELNAPLDLVYQRERVLLNQEWRKLQAHIAVVQRRRSLEQEFQSVQQHQQLGLGAQNVQPYKKQRKTL